MSEIPLLIELTKKKLDTAKVVGGVVYGLLIIIQGCLIFPFSIISHCPQLICAITKDGTKSTKKNQFKRAAEAAEKATAAPVPASPKRQKPDPENMLPVPEGWL